MITRTALITGSSKGLGVRTAHQLAANGIRVAINYRSNSSEHAAQSLKEELERTYGTDAIIIQGDVGKPQDADKMIQTVLYYWNSWIC